MLNYNFSHCKNLYLTLKERHRLREFENGVLRKVFGPKTVDVTGEWLRLHNGKIYHLHKWAEQVARVWRREVRTGFLWSNLMEKGHFEDPVANGE
jgi:hypothetical protein